MKKQTLFNIIAAIIGISIFNSDFACAKLPSYEALVQIQSQLEVPNKKEEETSPLFAKAVKPVLFKQTFGKEKVSIEFPKKPSVKKKEGLLYVETVLQDSEYSFIAPYRVLGETDPEYIFDLMLSAISDEVSAENLESNTYFENGWNIMDVTGFDSKDKEWFTMKVIVTNQNFYVIGVASKNNRLNPSHDRFINSITIR